MHDKKRAYYRNYYQENLARKQIEHQAEAVQSHYLMNEKSRVAMNRQQRAPRQFQSHRKHEMMEMSLGRENSAIESVKSFIIAVSLLLCMVVGVYFIGIDSFSNVDSELKSVFGEDVVSYFDDYELLMTKQNQFNALLSSEISVDVSSTVKTQLKSYQSEIQALTQTIKSYDVSEFDRLTSLFELKLLSTNVLLDSLFTEGLTVEIVDSVYHQYVTDQNTLGEQMTAELLDVLEKHEFKTLNEDGQHVVIQ